VTRLGTNQEILEERPCSFSDPVYVPFVADSGIRAGDEINSDGLIAYPGICCAECCRMLWYHVLWHRMARSRRLPGWHPLPGMRASSR
jgi:hypothetical protein